MRTNKSGLPGVYYNSKKGKKKWRCRGHKTVDGKYVTISLGYFATKEEAIAVRLKWQQDNGYSERHGKPAPETPQERFIKVLQERGNDTRTRIPLQEAMQLIQVKNTPSEEYLALYQHCLESGEIPDEYKELFVI